MTLSNEQAKYAVGAMLVCLRDSTGAENALLHDHLVNVHYYFEIKGLALKYLVIQSAHICTDHETAMM